MKSSCKETDKEKNSPAVSFISSLKGMGIGFIACGYLYLRYGNTTEKQAAELSEEKHANERLRSELEASKRTASALEALQRSTTISAFFKKNSSREQTVYLPENLVEIINDYDQNPRP